MDESSNKPTAGPNPNNPTAPYVPNSRQQRDSAGGSALVRTLDRNQGEGYRQFEKNNVDFDTKRRNTAERDELARQMHRRWQAGDAYSPHDMSHQELKKWTKPRQPSKDVIDMLGINPLDHYKVRYVDGSADRLNGLMLWSSCESSRPAVFTRNRMDWFATIHNKHRANVESRTSP